MLNLTEVILNEGKVVRRQEEITLKQFDFPFGSYPIAEASPLSLTVENTGNKVLRLQGRIVLKVIIPCARCLENVATLLPVEFDQEADMKLSQEERLNALDESAFLNGYNLDVDKLVYGEALLNWPAQVLCKEDCKGLCVVCGQNLNQKTCNCDRTDFNPFMAKIRDIYLANKEV